MKRLNVYLSFAGNCRAAMEFYRDSLGGKLDLMTMGESPMASQTPPESKNRVMHSLLDADGMVIMASDMMGQDKPVKGNTVSLCINGSDKKEIEVYFRKLPAGGKVTNPLSDTFFGTYGSLTDKFGVDWMFEADKPKP